MGPLVGMGAIRLEQMFPLTLGANIGTTMTALMAALVSDKKESLQVALAHLFFNITGIVILYPIPFMRAIPLNIARHLGKATRIWRGFPIVYILTVFVAIPLVILGISALFTKDTVGFTVLGSFIVIILGLILLYFLYWCKAMDGASKCAGYMRSYEKKRLVIKNLPEDMDYLKANMAALLEQTGTKAVEDVDVAEMDDKEVDV